VNNTKHLAPNEIDVSMLDAAIASLISVRSAASIVVPDLPAGATETPDRAAWRARWRSLASETEDLAENRLLRVMRIWNPASVADVEDCDITAVFAEPFGVIRNGRLVVALPADRGALAIHVLPLGSIRNLGPRVSFAGVDMFGAG
jgi:hypothetical protein